MKWITLEPWARRRALARRRSDGQVARGSRWRPAAYFAASPLLKRDYVLDTRALG